MSAEVGDVTHIQDEDLLRRMWQQTEDFGRKKEIRARMYKLREQRLKEFYTTGEVLSDVLSTSTTSLDGGRRNRQDITTSNLVDTSMNSQSSSQIITKSSSYATSNTGGSYSITHADSLGDEGFLSLKSKEIRDSESPTREFHQRQERNAASSSKNESYSSTTDGGDGGYWKVTQESTSGSYQSTGETGADGNMIVHSKSKTEHQNLTGNSDLGGFTTSTQVSSSEETTRIPRNGGAIELCSNTDGNTIVEKTMTGDDVTGFNQISASSNLHSGKWGSSSSSSYSTSSNRRYQQSGKISTTTSSTRAYENDVPLQDVSNVDITERTKFSTSTGTNENVISSSTAVSDQSVSNQVSSSSGKHRVTQRSHTGELTGRTPQTTDETTVRQSTDMRTDSDKTTRTTDGIIVDVNILARNQTADDRRETTTSSTNNKVVEQRIMSELHKLDNFLSTQQTPTDSTPATPGDTSNWKVVSTTSDTDKKQTVKNETDEFIFRSGRTSKDTTQQNSSTFLEQERITTAITHDQQDIPNATRPRDDKIPATSPISDVKPGQKQPSDDSKTPSQEGPKRSVTKQPTIQDTTVTKEGTDTTGQYVTTYQQAYTNKRISVDVSPTHDAFARSLRASPERTTPASSTRSSSKTSLDRSSPDRFSKSPTRSYRNRTSLDNSLATGRISPEKTPTTRPSPTRSSPEKTVNRTSPGRTSPEKSPGYQSSPTRTSPDKITKSSDRSSPDKTVRSPSDISFPTRSSPDKTTKYSSPSRTSPTRTVPDKTQPDKTSRLPERRVSSGDKPRDAVTPYSPTRKTSDSTKSYTSVIGTNATVKTTTTTKEKRKLSSGLSRATTKKRSSTPGASPHTSPTREEKSPQTERQSRPRSRGTSSRSSSDTENSDTENRRPKHVTDDQTTIKSRTNDIMYSDESSFRVDDDIITKVCKQTDDDTDYTRPLSEPYPKYNDKPISKSPSSIPQRTDIIETNITSKFTTEDNTVSTILKRKDSNQTTDKVLVKKVSKGEPSTPTDRSYSPTKSKPQGDDTTKTPTTGRKPSRTSPIKPSDKNDLPTKTKPQEDDASKTPTGRKPSSTSVDGRKSSTPSKPSDRSQSPSKIRPHDDDSSKSPTGRKPSGSPLNEPRITSPVKQVDTLNAPRDRSPEYSSEGSLINELIPKKPSDETPIKKVKDSNKDSSDSSPERENFKPIKCFRTSPEVRPSTLEFTQPQKQAPFRAPETASPTKPFKAEPGDTVDETTYPEVDKPSQESPSTRREPIKPSKPISTRDQDVKKSPERPTTSPIYYDEQTPDNLKKAPYGHAPLKPEKTYHDHYPNDKVIEDQPTEYIPDSLPKKSSPKSSSISPCSSSPERPSAIPVTTTSGTTAVITINFTAPNKKTTPTDKLSPTSEQPKEIPQKSRPQKRTDDYTSDSSPERGSPRTQSPTERQPTKPKEIQPSRQTSIPSRTSGIPRSGPATPEKPSRHPQDSQPSPTRAGEKPKTQDELSDKYPRSKIPSTMDHSPKPSKHAVESHTPRRESVKSIPSPDSSPDRSPTRSRSSPTPKRNYPDPINETRRLPLSPERPQETRKDKPQDRSPSSSPERHRSPVKSSPALTKTPTKPVSRLPQGTTITTNTDRKPGVPTSVRERPNQSPARPSQQIRPSHTVSRPNQSPLRTVQQPVRSSQSPVRPSQSPARPSKPSTRPSQSPARFGQSPHRPSQPSDRQTPKSAFVPTSHKPQTPNHVSKIPKEPRQPSQERVNKPATRHITTATIKTTKVIPISRTTPKEPKHYRPDEVDEGRSTDRSSTVSSPETVKTAGDFTTIETDFITNTQTSDLTTRKRTEVYVPQLSQDRDTSPSDDEKTPDTVSTVKLPKDVPSTVPVTICVTTHKKTIHDVNNRTYDEYVSDEYEIDEFQEETPPEEFYVEDDSPVRSPVPIKPTSRKPTKTPGAHLSKPQQKKPRDESPKPKSRTSASPVPKPGKITTTKTTYRTEAHKVVRDTSRPEYRVPEKKPATTSPLKNRPKAIATAEIRITRSSNDKNVIRRQTPSPSGVQPRRQTSKPDVTITRLNEKNTRSSSVRQQQVITVASTRVSTTKTSKLPGSPLKPTQKKILPGEEPKKSRPGIITTNKNQTVTTKTIELKRGRKPAKPTKKKLVNGTTDKPNTSSSEDEQEVPEGVTDEEKESPLMYTDDEPDESYIRELEELRKTEQQLYASKVTAVTTLEHKLLSPNQDVPGIVIQPLKSSRESSPEFPRRTPDEGHKPRYADRISEPEDDEDTQRSQHPKPSMFQHPVLHPEPLDEEYTSDDSKPSYRKPSEDDKPTYRKPSEDKPTYRKPSEDKPTYRKPSEDKPTYRKPSEDKPTNRKPSDDTKPTYKKPTDYTVPKDHPDDIVPRNEQVTDLDEESETDEALKSVSVADRVTRFLETTRKAAQSVIQQPETPKPSDSTPKPLDSPSTVRRARAMFENIATSQTTTQKDTTKQELVNIYELHRESPRESPTPDKFRPDDGEPYHPEDTSPYRRDEYPDSDTQESVPKDIPDKLYPSQKPSNEYPSDVDETSPHFTAPSDDDIEHTTSTYLRQTSPSPERKVPEQHKPTSINSDTYPRNKPVSVASHPYDTYVKSKPSTITKPEQPSNKYDTVTVKRRGSSDKTPKDDQPSIPQEPCTDIYKGKKPSYDETPDRKDSLPKKTQPQEFSSDTYPKRKPSEERLKSEKDTYPKQGKPSDTYPKHRQPENDFPEDTLLETFTKETTTQRELLRQNDILSRPSVFEARKLGQKSTTPLKTKTYAYPDRYPSDDDSPATDDTPASIVYSTDTYVKKKPSRDESPKGIEDHPNQENVLLTYTRDDITLVRKDSQTKPDQPQDFSTDTYPKRKPSKDDTSPRDSQPKTNRPQEFATDTYPKRKPSKDDTSPTKKETSPTRSIPDSKRDRPYDVSPLRKEPSSGETTPRESSPARKYSSPKDNKAIPKETQPREDSPSRKSSIPKDKSPTRRDSYPKGEHPRDVSPTTKQPTPKEVTPVTKQPRQTSNIRNLAKKFQTPQDTSPVRKEPFAKSETPSRKPLTPKDTKPSARIDDSPKRTSPTLSESTRKPSRPEDQYPTSDSPNRRDSPTRSETIRKPSHPDEDYPLRKDSPTRKPSHPDEDYPLRRDSLIRKPSHPDEDYPLRRDSPARKPSHPDEDYPLRRDSPARKPSHPDEDYLSRKDSPTRKPSRPDEGYPLRKDSPARKPSHPDEDYLSRKDSPTRKPSHPDEDYPSRKDSPTRKPSHPDEDYLSRKDSPTRKPSHPDEDYPLRKDSPTKKPSHPDEDYPLRRDSPARKPSHPDEDYLSRKDSPTRKPHPDEDYPSRRDSPTRKPSRPDEGYPLRKDSPARKPSHPDEDYLSRKDSPTRKPSHLDEDYPLRRDSPTRKPSHPDEDYPSRKDSPTRKPSHPNEDYPLRRDSPTRKPSRPDEGYPLRKDSPVRKPSHPDEDYLSRKDSPTRKPSHPDEDYPSRRDSPTRKPSRPDEGYPLRKDSPTRKPSHPDENYPRGDLPIRTQSTRKPSYPEEQYPIRRESSPKRSPTRPESTRKPSTPDEVYPRKVTPSKQETVRKPSAPSEDYPRSTSPTRREIIPKRTSSVRVETTRKPSIPDRGYPKDDSPTRSTFRSHPHKVEPSRKPSTDDSYPRGDSPTRRETSPKRTSPTRKPSVPKDDTPIKKDTKPTTRKNSQPKGSVPGHYPTQEELRPTEPSTVKGSGRFGVNLRRTSSTTSATITRRLSGEKLIPDKTGDELNIEEIFDLELLERMLEKAVGYDQRRSIRAQIRIVRRIMTESSTTVTTTTSSSTVHREDKTYTNILQFQSEQPRKPVDSDSDFETQAPTRDSPIESEDYEPRDVSPSGRRPESPRKVSPTRQKPSTNGEPEVLDSRPFESRPDDWRPSSPQKTYPESKPVAGTPRDSRPYDGRPEYDTPKDRRPDDRRPSSPQKTYPESKPVAGTPRDSRPYDGRPEYDTPKDRRPDDRRPSSPQKTYPESKPVAGTPRDSRPYDGRPEYDTPKDRRPDDRRPSSPQKTYPESKPVAGTPRDSRPYDGRPEYDTPKDRRPDDRRPSSPQKTYPDSKPVSGTPRDSRPYGGRPEYDVPEDSKPFDRRPGDSRPYGSRPGYEAPKDSRPSDRRPDDSRPYGSRPGYEAPKDSRPSDRRPDDSRPYGSRPGYEAPKDSRPSDRRPDDSRPYGSRPGYEAPKDSRPSDRRPDDSRPYGSRPGYEAPKDSRPSDRRPDDSRPYGSRPGYEAPKDSRPSDRRPDDSRPYGSRPGYEAPKDSRPSDRRPNDSRPSSTPQRPYGTRPESETPKDSKPFEKRPSSPTRKPYGTRPDSESPRESKPTQEKPGPVKKSSKTELNIELKPVTSPVKSPIKKSSVGEPPREAFPTDSVTSSYGVGPTDENGRPLFGLKALQRRQSTHNNIQIRQDTVDTAPTDESWPDQKPQETKPTEIRDSSGRPLFGGLRALKATSTTVTNDTSASTTTTATSKSSIVLNTTPRDRERAPSIDDDDDKDMPEQPLTSHLRELVSKHEQHSRGNTVSQPNAPRQKPRAKLRDSFILQSKDTETEKRTEETSRDTRVISQRAQSLKAIIQKHEKKTSDEPEQEPGDDYPTTDRYPVGDIEISRRPGILKKPRDDVVTETTCTSSATLINSRGTVSADGTVSLTRDVIQGESVSRPGEEPVSKITRSKYTYNTPEDKDSPALCYDKDDYDRDSITRKSSTSSRRSSSGKTPSPERNYPDDKSSKISTSSVTSSNSIRRSRVSEDERKSSFTSKHDKFSSTSPYDDTSRRPKGPLDKTADDKKFVSSTTTILSGRQKITDDNDVRRTRPSPDRESTVDTDYEPEHSTQRTEKYTSSTTTSVSQRTTGKTPDSVRRQIFTDGSDEEIDVDCTRRTSGSNYGKYSSSTTTSRTATSNLLDSERRRSSGIRGSGDERRSPLNSQKPDYDDESDGYQTTSRYVSRTVTEDTPRSTRRYSNDIETEEHAQRSEVHYSSSSVTQSRTVGGTSVTVVDSKSTPNQITGVGRRRSSTNLDGDHETSPTPSTGSSGFSRVARGGSVRALSQKFQQAAAEANSSDTCRSQQSYPKAGLIFRSASFQMSNGSSPATTPTGEEATGSTNVKQSVEVRSGSTNSMQSTPQAENEGKSFLTNQTRVTGVQDVLTRMRNADQEVQPEDTEEDAEARALLNKFLGAQVILQGMEPLVKGSQSQSAAALVSQVERQRVLSSQKTTTTSTNLEQDLEEIWDERVLRQLLEKCTDYEGRRLIRARLRVVMAEQKACAGVVAAALADEDRASQQEQEDGGKVLQHNVEEGESLLLPLLVEQLRSSLLLEKKSAGAAPPLALPPRSYSSQSSSEEGQGGRVEDSGTESGEDLKLLAVGLRDSIEFHRQKTQDKPQQKADTTATEPLGPNLLMEVQSALSRLQASLQLGVIGEGQSELLESSKRDSLLQLVSRLQACLRLPAPPWENKEMPGKVSETLKTKTDNPVLQSVKQAQRFANRKTQRQNRHTLAVTKEELADARRLIEENAEKEKLMTDAITSQIQTGGKTQKITQSSVDDTCGVLKQSSAGDLASSQALISPAVRAFRPVHFTPRNSISGATPTLNNTARPFFFLSKLQDVDNVENRRSSCSDIGNNLNNNIGVQSVKNQYEISRGFVNTINTKNSVSNAENKLPVAYNSKELPHAANEPTNVETTHEPSTMQPMIAVHREYRPGKLGQECPRPVPKSSAKTSSSDSSCSSKSSTPQRTESFNSVIEQPTPKVPSTSGSSNSSAASSNASTPLRSDSGTNFQERPFHRPVTKTSSLDSSSNSKASTPQRSDSGASHNSASQTPSSSGSSSNSKASTPQRSNSGPAVAERLQGRVQSQSSSRSDSGNSLHSKPVQKQLSNVSSINNSSDSKETSPCQPSLESQPYHKKVMQSLSSDSNSASTVPNPPTQSSHKPISHSISLDSGSSDYDPSVLLFTPAQSVQIAVHKAAINKQISIEEEKRQNQKMNEKKYESEEDGSDVEASSEAEDSAESDNEDEEHTSTVRQVSSTDVTSDKAKEPIYSDYNKNEDDRINNVAYPSVRADSGKLNSYNTKQQPSKKSEQIENWQYKQDALLIENKSMNGSELVHQSKGKDNWGGIEQKNPNGVNYAQYENPGWQNQQSQNPVHNMHSNVQNQSTGQKTQNPTQNVYTNVQQPAQNLYATVQQQVPNVYNTVEQTVENMYSNEQQSIQNVYANVQQSHTSNLNSVSSAQRLLQMATEDVKTSKPLPRPERKVKMKRANTIDIPKPLNFYEIEEESDYSSGEEYDEDKKSGIGSSSEHRAAYLALRGPIRVSSGNKPVGDKVPPPNFQPKTESDRKFLAFLQQHSNGKGTLWKPEEAKVATYNPSARGGHHWSSRFSNIKTAFETSAGKEVGESLRGKMVTSGPAAARMFWQSADDSVTVMKTGKSAAAANGPKLSKQGSIFLRKLFEQKEQEQQEQSKLPWAEKQAVPDDSVVIGSLTVAAGKRGTPGTVLSKKQLFTPPPSPTIHAPVNINKFSHAPLSAFRPIEKKQKNPSEDSSNQPWATPSVSGSVKQLAAQKFAAVPSTQPSQLVPKPAAAQSNKQKIGFTPYGQQTKQETLSPLSPTLPWAKDGTHQDHRIRNTALAKFENLSRETSPQPFSHHLHRSKSQEKIAVPGNLSVFVKQPESIPPPKSYIPLSHTPGSIQGKFQEKSNQGHTLVPPKQPLPIPSPPTLTAPHLIQNYDVGQTYGQQNFHPNHQDTFNVYQEEANDPNEDNDMLIVPEYSTKSYTTEIDYGTRGYNENENISPVPQTYSGNVISTSTVYPQKEPHTVSDSREYIPQQQQQPKPELLESPDTSLPSPEVFMAVSRVMGGPQSHQAVTVTHRTRHRYDEMDDEANGRSSAARNLSTVLTKFSLSTGNRQSPTAALKNREDAVQNQASKKSPSLERLRQDARESQHLLSKPLHTGARSPSSSIVRHHSEPDINSMISNEQFMEYQHQLQKKATTSSNEHISSSRNPVHSQYSSGLGRGLGQSSVTGSYPSLTQDSGHHPLISTRLRPASTESLITATSTEELQESGESVLTTRLQIPVYSNVNKVQNLAKLLPNSSHSNSLHDVSRSDSSNKTMTTSPNPASSVSPSLVLRKSESWHQLVAGQGIRSKRPQSLALTELQLPTGNSSSSTRKVPLALPKTKSSHSLSFPKQFEAALSPESVETKQRKVEEYLKAKNRSQEPKTKVKESQNNVVSTPSDLLLDVSLENVDEAFESLFNAAVNSRSKKSSVQKPKRSAELKLKASVGSSNEEQLPSQLSRSASSQFVRKQQAWEDSSALRTHVVHNFSRDKSRHSESKMTSSSTDGSTVTHTEVTTKTSSFSATAVGKSKVSKAPLGKAMSPFAKFQQLDRQSSSQSAPSSPKTPGGTTAAPLFKFTDPKLSRSASGVKDRLLFWCQSKTKEYKNIQIDNFSTCWSNGLAFCALIHHFLPDAFDYDTLKPEERRKNFELAFRVADEKAGIAPLLDVEDMVMMRKPDWKCVFTYVQSVYRRFKDED